jgi:hypothetical protein
MRAATVAALSWARAQARFERGHVGRLLSTLADRWHPNRPLSRHAPQPTFDQRNRRVSWGVVNRASLRPCRIAWWRRFSALRERVRMSTSR